jgi:hypothetical protein
MFNWFDKLLVKIAKKILNKYAPTGEFIAYINKQEEKVLKALGGYGQPINETGIKSFWDFPDWLKTAGKVAGSAAKYYIDYKDQERKSEVSEQAYRQYVAEVEDAKKEAQAAIDINLTPMEILNVPTTKADITDFTAVAAHGGLMNLPQRKRYAYGPNPEDIPTMDDMSPPFDPREEGIAIGEQVFYDTGRGDRANAMQIWSQMQDPDKAIFDFDFEIFFMDGGWSDQIKSEVEVGTETQMASDPSIEDSQNEMSMNLFNKPYHQLNQEELDILNEMGAAAPGAQGIMQAARGGRIGYNRGLVVRPGGYAGDFGSYKDYLEQIPDNEKLLELYAAGDIAAVIKELKKRGYDTEDRAKGGRIGYAYGTDKQGIMNLGGLEKDYRTTGGFVPIGAYEKKDDVPARLSKNEFVMTADAVRAAGGGSINKGAQRMYNTMKHLEASPGSKRMTA